MPEQKVRVRIQVIKVYDIDVPADVDPESYAYSLQSTEIEANGRLVNVTTDFAEVDKGEDI